MKRLVFIFSLFLINLNLYSSNSIEFSSIKELPSGEITISFKLEKIALIKTYALDKPSRIVMEIQDTQLIDVVDSRQNYPIKKIRASQNANSSKIVLDLYESVYWQKPKQEETKEGILLTLIIKNEKNLKESIRDIIIAIDAGHGGKYPGAVGPNNILEKDITLLIAKELERTLRDTSGYKPLMIRSGDETIDLNKRYQDARKSGADIFVSIHADGFRLSSVKGASVFIWSDEASSTIARNLSEKQRKRIQADINNLKPVDFNEDEARLLYPKIYSNKIRQSKVLGTKILNELKRDPFTKIHKKDVEYADFRVLKSVDIPSVLVESGFITNPEDANRLKGKPGRRMIARSIFLGVHSYFIENPIQGTYIKSNPGYLIYQIQKGDVLSEIAIRFGVAVDEIIKINELENKTIYPGQNIKINI
jgi:N-acetylmuramoyl-L-alanine amidase